MANNMVLNPDGLAVNLDEIRHVGKVEESGDSYFFEMRYKNLNENTFAFIYRFARYSDSKTELLQKVKNIRTEILKKMNGGVEVIEVLGGINLKKDGN